MAPENHPRRAPAAPKIAQKGDKAAANRGKNNMNNSLVFGFIRKKALIRSDKPERM
jgi:hypothetical protein